MLKTYLTLVLAVVLETIGTSALQASHQFTRLVPTLIMIIAYLVSMYLLALTLKVIPVGVAYALWSGFGIVCIAIIGFFVFHQRLDTPAVLGIGLILTGILVINLFSNTATH